MLYDQLKNGRAPVFNQRLILKLVFGLTDAYKGVRTLLHYSNPISQFYQDRSMLTLEEAISIKMEATEAQAAMVTTQPKYLVESSLYNMTTRVTITIILLKNCISHAKIEGMDKVVTNVVVPNHLNKPTPHLGSLLPLTNNNISGAGCHHHVVSLLDHICILNRLVQVVLQRK